MKMAINRVCIAGNLTRDAEIRVVGDGLPVMNFFVAINEQRKDRDTGEWVDSPVFVRCSMFGPRVEKLAGYLTKGTKVMVDGRLLYSTWMKDDEKRSALSIAAEKLEFTSSAQKQRNN